MIPLQKSIVRLPTAWICDLTQVPQAPLFPSRTGTGLTGAAIAKPGARHAATPPWSSVAEPGRAEKNITQHTLRHTCAMMLLHAGIDTAGIALWLGPVTIQNAQAYLHAEVELKRRTLDRLPTIGKHPPARYQASDTLIAFLADR